MTKQVALGNQKGGVGKTTTTVNIAAALAQRGLRVLVGDLDPQCNTTSTLDCRIGDYTLAEVMDVDPATREVVPGSAAAAIVPAGEAWPTGIDVLPASPTLAVREQDTWDGREHRLSRACEGVLAPYDAVLWDLPPNIGQMTVNGLTAADEAWIITDPTRYGLDGVALIMGAIDRVQRYHHSGLALGQVVINMFEGTRDEPKFRAAEIRDRYGDLVYDQELVRAEVVRKATGAAAPLVAYGAEGRVPAAAIDRLAATMFGLAV
ncbi:ParA family protein [Nocardiopsis sp. RV163]|uniref:ParA family protein n=1 Tax=Nocardiopsis sp. RV163 TaxID=1661388 RepID=UPI0009E1E307|nr:ParA family protein [Nocardiopsis sp. RV163]